MTRRSSPAPPAPAPQRAAPTRTPRRSRTPTAQPPPGPVPPASCVVALQLCDGGTPSRCATQTTTVSITPVNDAPVITSTPLAATVQGMLYTYTATESDPDGPAHTWSVDGADTCG